MIGGQEALWVAGCQRLRSGSARLRAALEGSKDSRMGRQACRTIARGALQPLALISGTVRPRKREGLGSGRPSAGLPAEPGVEVCWSLEVDQGIGEGLQLSEGERLDAGLLAGGQGAAAELELAEGEGGGFGLAAQPKDLAVGHAAGEVVDGDPTHGADLGNAAASRWCRPAPSAGWLCLARP